MKHASFRAAATTALTLAALGAVVLLVLPKYWVFLITAVFIVGIALQSLGLVTGRTGMISLCQMSFAGVGAWVTGDLNLIGAPGGLAVWMLIGGLAAVPVGVAIGLPALDWLHDPTWMMATYPNDGVARRSLMGALWRNTTPMVRSRSISASSTSRGNRYSGMP